MYYALIVEKWLFHQIMSLHERKLKMFVILGFLCIAGIFYEHKKDQEELHSEGSYYSGVHLYGKWICGCFALVFFLISLGF
jgi:hypothetical protein